MSIEWMKCDILKIEFSMEYIMRCGQIVTSNSQLLVNSLTTILISSLCVKHWLKL